MTRAKEDLELHTTVRITKKYPAPSESFEHTAERSHIISTPISLLRFQNNRLTCWTSRVRGFAHASRRWPETSNLLSVQGDTPRAEVSFRHGSVLRCAKLCANRETKTSLKKWIFVLHRSSSIFFIKSRRTPWSWIPRIPIQVQKEN